MKNIFHVKDKDVDSKAIFSLIVKIPTDWLNCGHGTNGRPKPNRAFVFSFSLSWALTPLLVKRFSATVFPSHLLVMAATFTFSSWTAFWATNGGQKRKLFLLLPPSLLGDHEKSLWAPWMAFKTPIIAFFGDSPKFPFISHFLAISHFIGERFGDSCSFEWFLNKLPLQKVW